MKFPVFLALIPLFGCDPVFAACHHMGDAAHPNACDEPVLEQATAKDSAKWTSDEKPRHNQTPAWAVDEVIVGSAKTGKEAKDGGWTPVASPKANPNPDLLPSNDAAPAGKNP